MSKVEVSLNKKLEIVMSRLLNFYNINRLVGTNVFSRMADSQMAISHFDLIRKLILGGADINLEVGDASNRITAAHLAILFNDIGMLQFLFKVGVDPNKKYFMGRNLLHTSVMCDDILAAFLVMEKMRGQNHVLSKEQIDAVDDDGNTVLLQAINLGRSKNYAIAFLQEGASFDVINNSEQTPRQLSIKNYSESDNSIFRSSQPRDQFDIVVYRLDTLFSIKELGTGLNVPEANALSYLIASAKEAAIRFAESDKSGRFAEEIFTRCNKMLAAVCASNVMPAEVGKRIQNERDLEQVINSIKRFLPKKPAIKKSKPEEVISSKSLAEWWQEHLVSLQKNGNDAIAVSDLMRLADSGDVDLNAKNKGEAAIHLAVKFGNKELLEKLISKGAEVIFEPSLLRLANEANPRNKNEIIKVLLNHDQVTPYQITDELKQVIKDTKLVLMSLREDSVVSKFSSLERKEREALLGELRSANKSEEVRKEIFSFEKRCSLAKEVSMPSPIPEEKRLSKNERERIRKEENRLKVEQEADKKKHREENAKMRLEDFDVGVVSLSVGDSNSPSTDSDDKSVLSADAPEFIPQVRREKKEMNDFLRGERKIKSVEDLPHFLQSKLHGFFDDGHLVYVKGGAAQQVPGRIPNDLDLEILVNGISDFSDEEIGDFVREKLAFGVTSIYREKGAFTVSIKDKERMLDISIYDSRQPSVDWITNLDKKIFFNPEKNYQAEPCFVFGDRCAEKLFINPEARSLILRLAFLETVGQVVAVDVADALGAIYPKNPIDLLFKELKLDKVKSGDAMNGKAKEQIERFVLDHFQTKIDRQNFLENLSVLAHFRVNPARINDGYEAIYEAINELRSPDSFSIVATSGKPLNQNLITKDNVQS